MTTLQDFRYALRTIWQAPGFSAVVTLTIALGVGATTAIFTIVDAVLLRPLPYPEQTSLVKLFDTNRGRDAAVLSFPEFIDWRDRGSDVFESVGAFGASGEALSGAGEAELLLGVQASREVPGLLGLRPILGRGLVAADELPGGPRVVVLGEHLWRSHFGADPGIVGRTITLTDVSYQVIGVFHQQLPRSCRRRSTCLAASRRISGSRFGETRRPRHAGRISWTRSRGSAPA